jgi:hypothetical protein
MLAGSGDSAPLGCALGDVDGPRVTLSAAPALAATLPLAAAAVATAAANGGGAAASAVAG